MTKSCGVSTSVCMAVSSPGCTAPGITFIRFISACEVWCAKAELSHIVLGPASLRHDYLVLPSEHQDVLRLAAQTREYKCTVVVNTPSGVALSCLY
jgi:hypothetical protein